VGYTYGHTDCWEGFFNYAVELGWGAVIYVPSFIKIDSDTHTNTHIHTHGQQSDLISVLYFFKIRKVGQKMSERTEYFTLCIHFLTCFTLAQLFYSDAGCRNCIRRRSIIYWGLRINYVIKNTNSDDGVTDRLNKTMNGRRDVYAHKWYKNAQFVVTCQSGFTATLLYTLLSQLFVHPVGPSQLARMACAGAIAWYRCHMLVPVLVSWGLIKNRITHFSHYSACPNLLRREVVVCPGGSLFNSGPSISCPGWYINL
jgi:hypothetical protein